MTCQTSPKKPVKKTLPQPQRTGDPRCSRSFLVNGGRIMQPVSCR